MRKILLYVFLTIAINVLFARISDLSHINTIPFVSFFGLLIAGFIIIASVKNEKIKFIGRGLLWGSLASFILAIIVVFNAISHWGC